MSKFRIEPFGYRRHKINYDLWAIYKNNEVTISETNNGGSKIICTVYHDDYGNGSSEFLMSFKFGTWVCDYARVSFDWNKSEGFITIDNKTCQPLSLRKSFRNGSAQNDFKNLCISQIRVFLKTAIEATDKCNNLQDLAKKVYKI